MVSAILRTTLRSRLPELARYRFAVQLDAALGPSGMQPEELERLWKRAQRAAAGEPGSDPAGILTKILAGPWRAELDAEDEQERHAAARARGSAAGRVERRGGPYGTPAPASAADVAGVVLDGLRRNHG